MWNGCTGCPISPLVDPSEASYDRPFTCKDVPGLSELLLVKAEGRIAGAGKPRPPFNPETSEDPSLA
jgi:hypothetical protein